MPIPSGAGAPAGTAAEVMARAIEASPTPPLIVPIGPWTTLAALFGARPDLVERVAGIHAMAGVIDAPGNVEINGRTSADPIEWNVAADPDAVAAVLALDIPVTLVPLDATDDVPVPADIAELLAADHAAAGSDIAYELELRFPIRARSPGTQFWDELAAVTIEDPTLATWQTAAVIVTLDDAPAGRILRAPEGRQITYAAAADPERSIGAILAGLRRGAPRPDPFQPAGELAMSWDGTACEYEGSRPTSVGEFVVRFTNTSRTQAGIGLAAIADPHTVEELVVLVRSIDLSAGAELPDWAVGIPGELGAEPEGTGIALVALPAGTIAVVCLAGEWPDLMFTPAASLELAAP